MRALIVYESMFGNTHEVAEQIGAGLRPDYEVEVVAVGAVVDRIFEDVDLLVVGGPTHAHGMSWARTRAAASDQAADDPDLEFERDADGAGLRDWFHALPLGCHGAAAAFDTRVDAPEYVTGHASKGIARRLKQHGFTLVTDPESFLVDRQNQLCDGEADRAREWAEALTAASALA